MPVNSEPFGVIMLVLWMNSSSKDNIHPCYPCHPNGSKSSLGGDVVAHQAHMTTEWWERRACKWCVRCAVVTPIAKISICLSTSLRFTSTAIDNHPSSNTAKRSKFVWHIFLRIDTEVNLSEELKFPMKIEVKRFVWRARLRCVCNESNERNSIIKLLKWHKCALL